MAWYDNAVFYHIYPLGLCGCSHENDGQAVPGAFEKLDAWAAHAAELGCTAIYIGPLFESGSHGYDTIDYRLVDRRLGTNEEFRAFVDACHARGQKVIVDGVFNHVGRGFFAFQDLKAQRENSRWRDWFCDLNFWGNNEYNDGFSYGNWGGYNLLVKLNQRNPEVQQYHFDTVRFWVEQFDIDGIRLDAADVLDFDFMRGLRRFTEQLKPEFWLMGEVIHGDYSRWANPDTLHSVTNYELHKGLWSGHNDHNYFEIAHTVRRLQGMCGNTRLYLFSDNHDVERLPNKLRNRAHIRNIAILLYTLWGIPSIYYGSEFAIEGRKEYGSDWPLRPCLELADFSDAFESNPVTSLYAALGGLKADYPALTDGEFRELQLTTTQYAFARVKDGQALVTVLNNADNPARLEFDLPVPAEGAEDLLADCVGSQPVQVRIEWGRVQVELPPNYGTILRLPAQQADRAPETPERENAGLGTAQRREVILQILTDSGDPVSASALARRLGVSRQIVVGDVALLRAGGAQIDATPRGYLLHRTGGSGYVGILACVHQTAEQLQTELYTVVDQGGTVVDVTVENALYGELRGNLNVASRYDADEFLRLAAEAPDSLLSRMTGGVHLHRIQCSSEAAFRRIEAELAARGILYQNN